MSKAVSVTGLESVQILHNANNGETSFTPYPSDGKCVLAGVELAYVSESTPQELRTAISLCRRCPVRTDCLDNALDDSLSIGVRGGTTENERRTEYDRMVSKINRARRYETKGRNKDSLISFI